ncbi:cyclic peptide export ABC transporter [Pseudoalteromonas piscicida]|uniref:cyclic peptide export ABC transporter n=1 Tax=Pseudoalteromonas piscicida TaxID=43662 RepID=UPI0032BF5BF1
MSIFSFFASKSPNKVFISILLGILAGVIYSLLIPIVLDTINTPVIAKGSEGTNIDMVMGFEFKDLKVALLFLATCLTIIVTRTISQIILTNITIDLTSDFRIELYKKVLLTSVSALEEIGHPKLVNAITIDVNRIVQGARGMPELLINGVTVLSLLLFLMYLDWGIFKFVIYAMIFGLVTHYIPMILGQKYFVSARLKTDNIQDAFRGAVYGAKELKNDDEKSTYFLEKVLKKYERGVIKDEKKGSFILRAAINYVDMVNFLVIGLVCFVLVNYQSVSTQQLVAIVMVLLYMTGPISTVLNIVPSIVQARVSYARLESIRQELKPEPINQHLVPVQPWDSIKFDNIEYAYANVDGLKGFTVGPLNFEIRKSTITFIVGSNGSGKSTLSKMITLHNSPTGGEIYFGDTLVDVNNIKSFRQGISSIYSNYYLFDRIIANDYSKYEQQIEYYLKLLKLDGKVSMNEGVFSTTTSLSDGQKRRLALLVAFIEDKELYLFDEWAADQDPVFKEFFYFNLLPELKKKGKAVVVISHDDRYFSVADNLLVLEEGKVLKQAQSHTEVHEPQDALID